MSKLRAAMVCETALAKCAKKIGLGDLIFLGRGEEGSGGRSKPSVTSDAYEALIGALFLDGGPEVAKAFVEREVLLEEPVGQVVDPKTQLQELAQAKGLGAVSYELLDESGPEHDKIFSVQVRVGESIKGSGSGHNKKSAEKAAAAEALENIKRNNG